MAKTEWAVRWTKCLAKPESLLQAATTDRLHDFDLILVVQGDTGEITTRHDLLINLYSKAFLAQTKAF